ncbi:hypothetical protein SLA2020_441740 [Shorea laevis]
MALHGTKIAFRWRFALALVIVMLFNTPIDASLAKRTKMAGLDMNAIDRYWRWNPNWRSSRQQLATCSVGFVGKMTNNIGRASYNTFTAIDGRGAEVHIASNACLMIYKASNIIIHGLRIHHCRGQGLSSVMGPGSKIMPMGKVDGDAIRLVTALKVWLDHNTLYECEDGLLDVTRGSTNITISNKWFRYQNKVMLLGHDDGYMRDKNMKVTIMYNHFGPNCSQRMPRIRYGYAHVVNNLYQGWMQYAIGGRMNPSVKSQANLFIAPKSGNKEVTWRSKSSHREIGGLMEILLSSFTQSGTASGENLGYSHAQVFPVADARSVRSLTKSSGALRCTPRSRC